MTKSKGILNIYPYFGFSIRSYICSGENQLRSYQLEGLNWLRLIGLMEETLSWLMKWD
jgi:hypothetical protein